LITIIKLNQNGLFGGELHPVRSGLLSDSFAVEYRQMKYVALNKSKSKAVEPECETLIWTCSMITQFMASAAP
jgi:hypothetical protein